MCYTEYMKRNPGFFLCAGFLHTVHAAALCTVCVLCVSCRGNGVGTGDADGSATLRTEVMERNGMTGWSDALEDGVLTARRDTVESVAPQLPLSPAVLAAASVHGMAAVYPELPGFGSLDVSALNEDRRRTVDGFCSAVVSGDSCDRYMAPGSIFALVLFLHDTAAAGPFLSYVYGRPFVTESIVQVPVRFVSERRHTDVLLYLSRAGSWKISQIQLQR